MSFLSHSSVLSLLYMPKPSCLSISSRLLLLLRRSDKWTTAPHLRCRIRPTCYSLDMQDASLQPKPHSHVSLVDCPLWRVSKAILSRPRCPSCNRRWTRNLCRMIQLRFAGFSVYAKRRVLCRSIDFCSGMRSKKIKVWSWKYVGKFWKKSVSTPGRMRNVMILQVSRNRAHHHNIDTRQVFYCLQPSTMHSLRWAKSTVLGS